MARPVLVAEPRQPYLVRTPIVVDSSLLCAVVFDEAERAIAQSHLFGHALHAPRLLDHEIANVTLTKQRKGLSAAQALQALQDYQDYDIELHHVDLMGHRELGARYGLSAYDAAYLWLAAELKVPLATFDRRLNEAAQAHFNDAR